MFQSFSFAPQCSKKINRKIFLGQKHEIGILTRHEISFQKPLKITFWTKMAKAIEKLRLLLAAQGVQLSLCAKSSSNQEL